MSFRKFPSPLNKKIQSLLWTNYGPLCEDFFTFKTTHRLVLCVLKNFLINFLLLKSNITLPILPSPFPHEVKKNVCFFVAVKRKGRCQKCDCNFFTTFYWIVLDFTGLYLTVHHAKLSSADRTTRLALETGGFRSEGEGQGGGGTTDLSSFSIGRTRKSSQDFFLSFFSGDFGFWLDV